MKIIAHVKTRSKEEKVEKVREGEYALWVKAPPREGKANEALISLLSHYFNLPKKRISIVKGHKSKTKIIEFS